MSSLAEGVRQGFCPEANLSFVYIIVFLKIVVFLQKKLHSPMYLRKCIEGDCCLMSEIIIDFHKNQASFGLVLHLGTKVNPANTFTVVSYTSILKVMSKKKH